MFSCGIIWENFQIFESNIFYFKVLWMVGEDGIMVVSSFCDVCSTVFRSISWVRCLPVVTAGSG